MSDQKAYRAKSATFASVSLTPVQQISVDEGGQTTDLTGDAASAVAAVFVDQIASDVTVEVSDIALGNNASVEVGDAGSLVIVYEQRADGRGAAASPNKTLTFANAVLSRKSPSAGTDGKGAITFTFRCPGSPTWT